MINKERKPLQQGFYGAFNYRPIVLIAIGLGIGVLSIMLNTAITVWACCLCCIMFFLSIKLKNKVVLLLAIAMLFGMFRATTIYPTAYSLADNQQLITGRVYSTIENSVVLDSVTIDGVNVIGRTLIKNVKKLPNVDDRIECVASLEQTIKMEGTTYKYYLLSEQYTFIAGQAEYIVITDHQNTLHGFFAKSHNAISNQIDKLFGRNSEMVKGILLGDTSEIPKDTSGNLKDSGISHLLSLSGLHVSIIACFVTSLIPKNKRRLSFFITVFVLIIYCAVTAFPASLLRATIMTTALLLGSLTDNRSDSLSNCALAFIIIIAVNPYQLFAAGFTLSFSAVVGIVLMNKPIRDMLSTFLNAPLANEAAIAISATNGIMPMIATYFHRMPFYAIISNVIAIPAVSLAVILSIIGLILGVFVPVLAMPFTFAVNWIIDTILIMSATVSKIPFAVITTNSMSVLCGTLYYMRMVAMSPFYITRTKYRLQITIALTLLTFAAFLI